jgi:hypothetical protein
MAVQGNLGNKKKKKKKKKKLMIIEAELIIHRDIHLCQPAESRDTLLAFSMARCNM